MRILFQGDSIIDVGRARNNDVNIGVVYPLLIKASLSFDWSEPRSLDKFNIN